MYYYDSGDWLYMSCKYVISRDSLRQDYTFSSELEYIMNNIK